MNSRDRSGHLWEFVEALLLPELRGFTPPEFPWLNVYPPDPAVTGTLWDACTAHDQPPTHAVLIQGSRSRTSEDLVSAWGDALEFPAYYGNNWDAFNECFRDLIDLREGGIGSAYGDRQGRNIKRLVIMVANAHQLLDKDPSWNLRRFIELVDRDYRQQRAQSAERTCELYVALFTDGRRATLAGLQDALSVSLK